MVAAGKHMCCNKKEVKRGAWSPAEEEKLRNHSIMELKAGPLCLNLQGYNVAAKVAGRSRWLNYLRPGTKRGNFAAYEAFLASSAISSPSSSVRTSDSFDDMLEGLLATSPSPSSAPSSSSFAQ